MSTVFISYATEDEKIALDLYNHLKDHGIKPWIAANDINPGEDWELSINAAIENCSFFICLLSQTSLHRKSVVHKEIKKAIDVSEHLPTPSIFIIPVRVDDSEIKDPTLKKLQHVDLFDQYDTGFDNILKTILQSHENDPNTQKISDIDGIFRDLERISIKSIKIRKDYNPATMDTSNVTEMITQRSEFIHAGVLLTLRHARKQIDNGIKLFRKWMLHSFPVRILGVGRARLAGAIPGQRLAHGGARIFTQGTSIPMPHSIRGGGIIALSASGNTESVLHELRSISKKGENVDILGITKEGSSEFVHYCDPLIEVKTNEELPNPLRALADAEEYVMSEILDAMVVAAGKSAGFDDATWRMGHEDIETGPYGFADMSIL